MSTEKILFSQQVEYFAEFIRTQFPQQKVSLAGLSYGGALSWALALEHPELVEKMILINPLIPDPVSSFALPELRYFFVIPVNLKAIYMMLSTPIGRAFLKRAAQLFRDERTSGAVSVETLKGRKLMFVAHMIHHFAWILRTADWPYWLNKLKMARVDTMLVYDREDMLLNAKAYQEFSKEFHCEKVIEITGAGHIAIKARPETIAKHIHEYLRGLRNKKSA